MGVFKLLGRLLRYAGMGLIGLVALLFLGGMGWIAFKVLGFYGLGAFTVLLLLIAWAGPETPEIRARRKERALAAAAKKHAARAKTVQAEKKRGPLAGSHTVEAMLFEGDPIKTAAARKVRDTFF